VASDVRFWSEAAIRPDQRNVRFAPIADISLPPHLDCVLGGRL